ncbi:MAG: T9SS type A sorting domain-containing protein [Fimbriimonadaceae bacterium]|nr:T9SS type A sorting domain-containing protein [Chitinophagales bacterium]
MKKLLPASFIVFSFLICINTDISAQVPLDTFIGLTSQPADDDAICDIPTYPDVDSDLEGPYEGALVHDFKLYTMDGDSVQLSGLLNDRKPVVLISCSYTCYVYRHKLNQINTLLTTYGDAIHVYLVYTVEAHPIIDVSPYFGYENVGDDNYEDGVLYRQPTTYGERKEIITEMLANETVDVPILIDGPCNDWWQAYGTVPNGAFLIDPDGYIYDAQNWFNKDGEDMYASIDALLDIVGEGTFEANGTFTAEEEGEVIYYGTVDNVIAAHITLTNSSADDVLIDFMRTGESVPAGWYTSLCTDLCYSPSIDSTTVYLTPGQSEEVRLDFFTDLTPASGSVNIICKNHNDPTNMYGYTFNAESIEGTAIESNYNTESIQLSPNPANKNNSITLSYPTHLSGNTFKIYSVVGTEVMENILEGNGKMLIDILSIPTGTYFISVTGNDEIFSNKLIIN